MVNQTWLTQRKRCPMISRRQHSTLRTICVCARELCLCRTYARTRLFLTWLSLPQEIKRDDSLAVAFWGWDKVVWPDTIFGFCKSFLSLLNLSTLLIELFYHPFLSPMDVGPSRVEAHQSLCFSFDFFFFCVCFSFDCLLCYFATLFPRVIYCLKGLQPNHLQL